MWGVVEIICFYCTNDTNAFRRRSSPHSQYSVCYRCPQIDCLQTQLWPSINNFQQAHASPLVRVCPRLCCKRSQRSWGRVHIPLFIHLQGTKRDGLHCSAALLYLDALLHPFPSLLNSHTFCSHSFIWTRGERVAMICYRNNEPNLLIRFAEVTPSQMNAAFPFYSS